MQVRPGSCDPAVAHVILYVGNLGNAQELTTQSLGVYSQVFGPLHSDVANCYRYLTLCVFVTVMTNKQSLYGHLTDQTTNVTKQLYSLSFMNC